MKVSAEIKKWGNGLALRLSGPLKDIPGFKEGMAVEIEATEHGLIVSPKKKKCLLPYSEDELIAESRTYEESIDLLAEDLPKEVDF